jgi:hypothetical protein
VKLLERVIDCPGGYVLSAQPLEIRRAHLEGAYEQVSQRLNGIDRRLENLEQKVGATRDMLLTRIDHLDQKFLWLIGLVLVSILLPLVQRVIPHG